MINCDNKTCRNRQVLIWIFAECFISLRRECQLPPLMFIGRYLKIPFEVCGSPLWGILLFIWKTWKT